MNFTENASVYFYGCQIAKNKDADGNEFYPNGDDYLQLFSDYQQVKVFANRFGTSFSSDPKVKKTIFDPSSQNVYLGSYALDSVSMPHKDVAVSLFPEKDDLRAYFLDGVLKVDEILYSTTNFEKLKRIPFVVYYPNNTANEI